MAANLTENTGSISSGITDNIALVIALTVLAFFILFFATIVGVVIVVRNKGVCTPCCRRKYEEDYTMGSNNTSNPYIDIISLGHSIKDVDLPTPHNNDDTYLQPIYEGLGRSDTSTTRHTTVNRNETEFASQMSSKDQGREKSRLSVTDPSLGATFTDSEILCSSAPVDIFPKHGNSQESDSDESSTYTHFGGSIGVCQTTKCVTCTTETNSDYLLTTKCIKSNRTVEVTQAPAYEADDDQDVYPNTTEGDFESLSDNLYQMQCSESPLPPKDQLPRSATNGIYLDNESVPSGCLNRKGEHVPRNDKPEDVNENEADYITQMISNSDREKENKVSVKNIPELLSDNPQRKQCSILPSPYMKKTSSRLPRPPSNDNGLEKKGKNSGSLKRKGESVPWNRNPKDVENEADRIPNSDHVKENKVTVTAKKCPELTLNIFISNQTTPAMTRPSLHVDKQTSVEFGDSRAFDIYEVPDDVPQFPSTSEETSSIPPVLPKRKTVEASESESTDTSTNSVDQSTLSVYEPTEVKQKLFDTDFTNRPWTVKGQVTEEGCQICVENSEISLTIPPNAVDVPTRVSGSTLYDIPKLRERFNMQTTESLVAPVVEFQLEQVKSLQTYARIQIPHCMGQNVDQMQVWWFSFDRSENKIERRLVTAKGRQANVVSPEDMYWTLVDHRTINIYTKHFSGFLCTACNKHVDFDIKAYLFHVFGDIDDDTTVSFNLKLAGPLSRIYDFEQIIISEMKDRQYTLVKKKNLSLGKRKEGCLHFSLEMVGKTNCDWHPVKRANGQNVFDDQQETTLDQLIVCGSEHVIAAEVEWYLQCNSEVVKRFSVCVDIKHVVDEDTKPIQTTVHGELIPPPPKYVYMGSDPPNSNLAHFKKTTV